MAFAPALLVIALAAIAALLLALTRWSSLAMLVSYALGSAAIFALALSGGLMERWLFFPLILLPITIYRYRGNIQRLWAGTERRIGERLTG